MNIWFVSIFENTPVDDNQNTRFNSLVREAHKRGHKVTFWASTFKHNVKKQRYDKTTVIKKDDRLTLQFIKSKPYYKNISLKRLYSHHDFSVQLVQEFDRDKNKPDAIMIAFPPVSSAYIVSEWAQKNGVPVILDIIDPWPDVFKAHLQKIPHLFSDLLFSPLRRKVKKTLQQVSAVTGISNQYIEWAKSYYPDINKTKCFYPAVQFDQMKLELEHAAVTTKKKSDQFNVIYAGSLGYSYDIPTILKAAAILEADYGDSIHFTIAGDGPQKDRVEAYQKNHENLEYIGRIPKEKLMEYYYRSDMGMTQHIQGATQSVTYKLFDLLACGLPILNSLESEMKNIILDNKVGLHNEPGNAGKLAENIAYCFENKMEFVKMKSNAINLVKQLGDSKIVYAEAIDFIESFQDNLNDG